jgi:hypothetical protein
MGQDRRRLPAGEVCRERKWKAGTVLRSSRWADVRTLTYVGPVEVQISSSNGPRKSYVYVRSLPADIEAVS